VFRSRDLNAPPPPFYYARPNPEWGVLRQIESAGDLESHSLEIGLRGNVTRYFTGMVQYTLGRAYNNVGGTPAGVTRNSGINVFPANNYDLSGEWSRADFDQRHRFSLLGTLTPGKYFKLGAAVSLYSGQPYTETTGRDDNHDGLANDRPLLTNDRRLYVPRNSLQGPGYADVDLRWSHDFFLAGAKKGQRTGDHTWLRCLQRPEPRELRELHRKSHLSLFRQTGRGPTAEETPGFVPV
jgi:hypothetical protein